MCRKKNSTEETQGKIFESFLVCTAKGKSLDKIKYANSFDKNLQFTLQTHNGNGYLVFIDLNINVNDERKISSH